MPISDDLRRDAYASASRLPIACLRITHADLVQPIRVANNTTAVTFDGTSGEEYAAFPFEVSLPDSLEDSPPTARLRISNVSREIGEALRSISTPASITLYVTRVVDASTNPAVVAVEMALGSFRLANVQVDALEVEAQLTLESDLVREPYPAYVFSPAEFPGLVP